jgi:hypothetical protein
MDLAVLGGDPRSTVGGGSAAAVLDDAASDGIEMISASTAMGPTNPKMKTSKPIAERLECRARSLIGIDMMLCFGENTRNIMLPLVRNNFREGSPMSARQHI